MSSICYGYHIQLFDYLTATLLDLFLHICEMETHECELDICLQRHLFEVNRQRTNTATQELPLQ